MNLLDYDFSYLVPPQEVLDVQHDDYYIQHGEGSQSVRKIFANVPYNDFEKQKLREFEDMIRAANVQLPPWWTTALTMKYVYSAKFALEKCFENLKAYLEWLKLPARTTLSPKSLEILKEGIVYLAGRDKQFRPIIHINVDRVDLKKMAIEDFTDALCFLCSAAEKYCYVPGKVENWIIIIETNNMGLWSFPFKILQNIISTTSVGFTSTLDKLYIMNPSRILKGSWNLIQKLLHPETAAKISMIDKSEYKVMLEKISPDQLEMKYGGNLSPPTVFWPPVTTMTKPPYKKIGAEIRSPLNLDIDSSGIDARASNLVIKSSRIPDPSSPMEPGDNSSVYYDFDTVYMDIPGVTDGKLTKRRNSELDKGRSGVTDLDQEQKGMGSMSSRGGPANGTASNRYSKINQQLPHNGLILERKAVNQRCCGTRGGSDSESGCSIF